MTTARTFGTNPATRRMKRGMLIAFGLLLSTSPLVAADNEMSNEYRGASTGPTGLLVKCLIAWVPNFRVKMLGLMTITRD
jgi:hypothetical protein